MLEEVVRANFLEVITKAASELVENAEDRDEAREKLFAISGYLRELAGLAEKAAAKLGRKCVPISTVSCAERLCQQVRSVQRLEER